MAGVSDFIGLMGELISGRPGLFLERSSMTILGFLLSYGDEREYYGSYTSFIWTGVGFIGSSSVCSMT